MTARNTGLIMAQFRSDDRGANMPSLTGKRYTCETCGAQVIVTKGGNATIYCKHADGSRIPLKQQ